MGRPCSFDRDEAVQTAMCIFLEKGYEGASIEDLTEGLGISRASLYNSFGDKRGLLNAAFGCAEQAGDARRTAILQSPGTVREVIRGFFESLMEQKRGCFFLTLGAEMASADKDVRKRVRASLDATRLMLLDLVRRGQASGEIDPERDAEAMAATLLGAVISVAMLERVYPDKKILGPVVDQAIATLG